MNQNTETGPGIVPEEGGATPDQFALSHYENRLAETVVNYERKLANAALQQQLMAQEIERLTRENVNLMQELEDRQASEAEAAEKKDLEQDSAAD